MTNHTTHSKEQPVVASQDDDLSRPHGGVVVPGARAEPAPRGIGAELPADGAATPPRRRPVVKSDQSLELARAESDARRQAASVLRDVVASERDRAADQRDDVAARADAALLAAHPNNAQLRATLAEHAALREQFRSSRGEAGRDRRRAAEDRMQAAIDRHEARVDRDRAAEMPTAVNAHRGVASGRIAARLVGLHKQHRGRGPETVDVQCLEHMVTVVMRGDASRLESFLNASGHSQAVENQRGVYEQLMKPRLIEVTEQELGRTVEAFLSVSHHDPDLTIEIFMLAARQ